MTLPLAFPDVMFTEPAALFGVTGEIGESSGTVSLTTYSAEEITGVVRARGQDINGKPLDIVATFDAHRCDRIHD